MISSFFTFFKFFRFSSFKDDTVWWGKVGGFCGLVMTTEDVGQTLKDCFDNRNWGSDNKDSTFVEPKFESVNTGGSGGNR